MNERLRLPVMTRTTARQIIEAYARGLADDKRRHAIGCFTDAAADLAGELAQITTGPQRHDPRPLFGPEWIPEQCPSLTQ